MINDPTTLANVAGIATGTSLAVVCSWARNRSILWAMLHAGFSWGYVVYFAATGAPTNGNNLSTLNQ
jgi:hypothetical protein